MLQRTFKVSLLQKVAIDVRLLITKKSSKCTNNSQRTTADVPGLTDKCVKVPSTPVGPNAAKDQEYKNPEYFCYHINTFSEAEVELSKYRLPAPSNKKPYQQ